MYDSRYEVIGRSVCLNLVLFARGSKGNERVEGPGKLLIPCSKSLPSNTSVDG